MEYRSRSHQQQEEDGMGYNNPSLPPQAAPAGAAAAAPMRGLSAFSKPSAPTPAAHSNILLPQRSAFPSPLPLRNGMDSVVNTTISAGSAAEVAHRRGSTPDPLLLPTATTISPSSPAPAAPPPPPPPTPAAVKYKECLRNHAASVGGHVLDGCGEYMAADETDGAMKCAACGCHRSFHRRETEGDGGSATAGGSYYRRDRIMPVVPLLLPPPHPSAAAHNHHHQYQHNVMSHGSYKLVAPAFPPSPSGVAIGGNNNSGSGATTESSSEDRQDQQVQQQQVVDMVPMMMQQQQQQQQVVVSKKRFRTKFTAEQKEKMLAFAERVGWRFQKQDEAVVEHFCREAGVRRQVLKVWMHNNKHSIKKQQQEQLQLQQQQQQQQQPLQEM